MLHNVQMTFHFSIQVKLGESIIGESYQLNTKFIV